MRMLEKLYSTAKKVKKRPDRVYIVNRAGGGKQATHGGFAARRDTSTNTFRFD
jgi:hypothetical protein